VSSVEVVDSVMSGRQADVLNTQHCRWILMYQVHVD